MDFRRLQVSAGEAAGAFLYLLVLAILDAMLSNDFIIMCGVQMSEISTKIFITIEMKHMQRLSGSYNVVWKR